MLGRTSIAALTISMIASPAVALAAANDGSELVLRREEEAAEVIVAEDDGDDLTGNTGNTGGNTGNTGGNTGNTGKSAPSNDSTGSGYTPVSKDQDRSRGDKTRDWTKDGGSRTRDRSGGHTNDASRNDTR